MGDIAWCAPFGTDGICPGEYIAPSPFTLSRARNTVGFLAAVCFFADKVLYCEGTLGALVSSSLAEVLCFGNKNISIVIVMNVYFHIVAIYDKENSSRP